MSVSCDWRRACGATLAVALASAPQLSLAAAQTPPEEGDEATPVDAGADVRDEPSSVASSDEPADEQSSSTDADRAEALAAFRRATKSYELGKYEEAIEGFERAWELTEAPQLLYNLGQAYWKRFDVEPELDHLRRAKVFFQNYDKRMQGAEFYDPTEVHRYVEEIEAQIEKEEAIVAERNRPIVTGPSLAAQEAELRQRLERERQLTITRGLNVTGITLIVLGSASLAMGVVGLTTRLATGAILDNSSGGGGVNLASAAQDSRRRRQYLLSGQLSFVGFIGGAVLLPVGITLRVVGKSRTRKGLGEPKLDPEPTPEPGRGTAVSFGPSGGLLTVHF